MELDYAKEIDWRCVMDWLYEIYIDPSDAFSKRSDSELKELANDALVLLEEKARIVKCKNCKHCDEERIDRNMIWCKLHQFARHESYYCADGKTNNK